MTGPATPPRPTITARLGSRAAPVTRAGVLAWESRRAARALGRLGVAVPDGDVETRRAAVVAAKMVPGRAEIEHRLAREVAVTDRLTRLLARTSRGRRRVSQVELRISRGTAQAMPAWYLARADADDEAAFLGACPDHHLFRPTPDGTGQEVWETTGGSPLASRSFFALGDTDAVVTPADPSYPVQLAGVARLVDGTLIGGIRHQFRDEPDGGVRALLTVELPWLIGPVAPAAHTWHLACEFSNWVEAAVVVE